MELAGGGRGDHHETSPNNISSNNFDKCHQFVFDFNQIWMIFVYMCPFTPPSTNTFSILLFVELAFRQELLWFLVIKCHILSRRSPAAPIKTNVGLTSNTCKWLTADTSNMEADLSPIRSVLQCSRCCPAEWGGRQNLHHRPQKLSSFYRIIIDTISFSIILQMYLAWGQSK